MTKHRPPLNELEDRLLAMAEGEWIDLEVGTSILEQWFERRIEVEELAQAIERLMDATLLRLRVHGSSSSLASPIVDEPLDAAEIVATSFGELYLAKVGPSSDDA